MKVQIDENLLPKHVPLYIFEAIQIGTAENASGDKFSIYVGLTNTLADQLRERSLDPSDVELDQNTSDRKRFGEGSYEEWYSKNRVPFALVHDGDDRLAAIVWYGPKPLGRKSLKHLSDAERATENDAASDEWHTVSYRSYPPFRGKGVMKDFALATQEMYLKYFPKAKLWTGVDRANGASVALSQKLGFHEEGAISDEGHVVMVRD